MNREATEQDWLDFYEVDHMCKVETCRKDDLRNHYGSRPDRQGYIFAEWRHYAESQMWLDKANEILSEKTRSGSFKLISKKQLAFILDYLHEDAVIPVRVMLFLADSLRGNIRKGPSKSIVRKWKDRITEYRIAKDRYGDLWGGKPCPDLPGDYINMVEDIAKKYSTNKRIVQGAFGKYNPKNIK